MADVPKKEIIRAKATDIAAVDAAVRHEFERVILDPDFFQAATFMAQCKRAFTIVNGSRGRGERVAYKHMQRSSVSEASRRLSRSSGRPMTATTSTGGSRTSRTTTSGPSSRG